MLNALAAAKLIGDKPAELCDTTVLDLNLFHCLICIVIFTTDLNRHVIFITDLNHDLNQ